MKVNVIVDTEILKNEKWNRAIQRAQNKTKRKGIERLQSLSPVDTGFLNRNWRIDNSRMNMYITNNAHYSGYLDKGTRYIEPFAMTEKALPYILEEYENNILDEIDSIL